eukprot:UN16755
MSGKRPHIMVFVEMSYPYTAILMSCKYDGFGARYTGMISIYAKSKLNGIPFCQTKWVGRSHGANTEMMWNFMGVIR